MLDVIALTVVLASAARESAVATQASTPQQPPASGALTERAQRWPPAGVSLSGHGVTPPRLIKEVKPKYPTEAKRAKVEGAVQLEAVIKTNGKVGEVRVTSSLDREFGLDDEAIKTVKRWRFAPAMKDGVAVPVVVEIEMTFTLR